MSQIIREATGDRFPVVTLSPLPCREVAEGPHHGGLRQPGSGCGGTGAGPLPQRPLRVYSSSDVVGVELGAALKNVMALCTGCCTGMGYGDNTRPCSDRGLAEWPAWGVALGPPEGDLCRSGRDGGPHRHLHLHELSELPGRHSHRPRVPRSGGHCKDRRRGGGYYAAGAARALAQKVGVEMPITEAAYEVLYQGRDPKEAILTLMRREKRHEIEETWG